MSNGLVPFVVIYCCLSLCFFDHIPTAIEQVQQGLKTIEALLAPSPDTQLPPGMKRLRSFTNQPPACGCVEVCKAPPCVSVSVCACLCIPLCACTPLVVGNSTRGTTCVGFKNANLLLSPIHVDRHQAPGGGHLAACQTLHTPSLRAPKTGNRALSP
jgi:hypothetical protein